MAAKRLIFLFFSFPFLLQFHFAAGQNSVKAAYWSAGSEYPVSSINSTLFTHLFCAFADLNSQTNQVTVAPANQARFSSFTSTVRSKNPNVRTLLSIGGGSSSPAAFASMASQASSRKSFIDSSINIARSYNFHGLDLDWEYPSTPTEMNNLGLLLNEWRTAVNNEAARTGTLRLLLSAAFFRNSDYYTLVYPITAIRNSLDWINVMAYDFYGPGWSNVTGPPAALYNPGTQVSGNYGIRSWICSGIPENKLVLGFPFYGYAWTLVNPNNNGFFAPTTGAALTPGGDVGYGQIRSFIAQNNATEVYNETVVSNYCFKGTTWIGYDDTQSIRAKVTYCKQNTLLGYFAWHVGADDNWILSRTASQTWGS
ncbi:class V chitinase-like [Hibiscus syriacus]|uniref:class V chitinase-like n=1 Tax=Hibiscus syriacus TaxID=106335 RepID=UPI00192469D2|nr:class V chitinase-like [Hibiscus syriacus]